MIGFGCIGQGVLPLLLRHIAIEPDRLLIVTDSADGIEVAEAHGVAVEIVPLTRRNYLSVLEPRLAAGDFLVNLSVDVSSVALLELTQRLGVMYLDTCIEPWAGGYLDARLPPAARTNYALRETALALRKPGQTGPTAILTHGANPGLVSHFVKQALLDLARDTGMEHVEPADRRGWASLAQALGVRAIHIAERDTQVADRHKEAGEFVNTWSIDGFVSEGCQPAELGWGTHEQTFPADGARHADGSRAAIYLKRPGAATRVRTWTPMAGPQHGFMITHSESISIADYLTLGDPLAPAYRPTVYYAYHPCDDAVLSVHELAGHNWRMQPGKRLLMDDIVQGTDALGVLLMGHARGAYWYGSMLDIETTRALCPHNNATSLQVTASVMSGVIWAMRNPARGILEPDELPHREIMEWCAPYLGNMVGVYTDWTPLQGRGWLMDEAVEAGDPWQFGNFRVT
ncbi:MAG: homospermidine synthase [Pseudomonadales bacterium]|nr:homospermidine synthase [Pseudomonadales bacterium]